MEFENVNIDKIRWERNRKALANLLALIAFSAILESAALAWWFW